jgi:hypothetical protein
MLTSKHVIGISASATTAALIVVGFVSGEIARHVLQTLLFWPAIALGFRNSDHARWTAAPVLLFWFLVMALIWAYLLHWSTIASGTYSPAEIAMTVVVGIAAPIGLAACFATPLRPRRLWLLSLPLFLVQFLVMTVSLKPPFENDRQFLAWILP